MGVEAIQSQEVIKNEEIVVPETSILRHPCREVKLDGLNKAVLEKIPTEQRPLPVFEGDWFLANIGTDVDPLFLELRFAPLSPEQSIALLMTTERSRQNEVIGGRMVEVLEDAGIRFNCALGIPELGNPLAQAMSVHKDEHFYWASVGQKGRTGEPMPKPWLNSECSIVYQSGTKPYDQVLYVDPVVAKEVARRKELESGGIVIGDDARLSGGLIEAAIKALRRTGEVLDLDLEPSAVISVLNEHEETKQILGVPYFSLAKVPIFRNLENGYQPIEGTFEVVNNFYVEFD